MPVTAAERSGLVWEVTGEGGMMFARDRAAGDDEYLFMTPCHPYSSHDSNAIRKPAVAFPLSYVIRRIQRLQGEERIAFRATDLEPYYKRAEINAEVGEHFESDELDEIEDDDERRRFLEEMSAEEVAEELGAVATCGTQWDEEDAIGLVYAYARLCGAFRGEREQNLVPVTDPERRRVYEAAERLFPDCILEHLGKGEGAETILNYYALDRIGDDLAQAWAELFGGPTASLSPFPHQLLRSDRADRPELLVQAELPLCDAAFYRDGSTAWREVPEAYCREGRAALASNPVALSVAGGPRVR